MLSHFTPVLPLIPLIGSLFATPSLFVYAIPPPTSAPKSEVCESVAKKTLGSLDIHNRARCRHSDTPDLVWSRELAITAELWSMEMAATATDRPAGMDAKWGASQYGPAPAMAHNSWIDE